MSIRCGTSGWSYRSWERNFYPQDVKGPQQLAYYSRHYNAVEINATAYRTPTVQTVVNWRERVPCGFTCAVKMSHDITHRRRLQDCEHELGLFLQAINHLGDRRGPMLIQLPPGFAPNHRRLATFLDRARRLMSDDPWRIAVEFRHPGWIHPDTTALLNEYGVAWCLGDMPACTVDVPNQVDFVYIRRHGLQGTYTGSYSEYAIGRTADVVNEAVRRGHDAYIFFNNTFHGDALNDAERLLQCVNRAQDQRHGNCLSSVDENLIQLKTE